MLAVLDLEEEPFTMEAELEAGGASEEEEGEALIDDEDAPLASDEEDGEAVRLVEEFLRLNRGAIFCCCGLRSALSSCSFRGGFQISERQARFFRDRPPSFQTTTSLLSSQPL